MALLSGYRQITEIHRFGQRLTQAQRRQLGLPLKKGTKFYQSPGYKVYYHLLRKMDPELLARVLTQWLMQHQGELPAGLAMDGKMVRETIGVLTLAEHETGAPYAMAPMSMKEGDGERCEIKSAQRLIEETADLTNKLITSDALHCQDRTAQSILERGGDYLVQVKDNQKTVRQCVQNQTHNSPFLSSSTKLMGELKDDNSR
jgi:predicted transposase YbfD/YdcC